MPFGPWPGTGGGGGGGFPGFGGAPLAVASASSAGVGAFASRSDHTHAQDLSVVYGPSLGAMQASGVVQQTWVGPAPGNATPAALTMVAGQIPFGVAGGVLGQSANIVWSDAAAAGLTLTQSVSNIATPIATFVSTDATGPFLTTNWKTPGTAGQNEFVLYQFISGAATVAQWNFLRSSTGTYGGQISISTGTNVTALDNFSIVGTVAGSVAAFYTQKADVFIGSSPQLAVGATNGFTWIPSIAGPPVGAPQFDNNFSGSGFRRTFVIDNVDQVGRYYSYVKTAWHYVQLTDYTPTATRIPFGAATAGTQTDSASLFYTTGTGVLQSPLVETNTVGGFGGGGTLSLENNHAAPTVTLGIGPTRATLTGGDFFPAASATKDIGNIAFLWNHVWGATMHAVNYFGFVGATPISFTDNAGNLMMMFQAGAITFSGTAWGVFGSNAVQQVGGALVAGGAYTAVEQGMINSIWTALRAYALLT